MGSHTEEELQALNMTDLKKLDEAEGGKSLAKDDLVAYILNGTAAKNAEAKAKAAEEAEAEAAVAKAKAAEGPPQEGDEGTATFELPDGAQRRTVVGTIDGERHELEFYGGKYTTRVQAEVDALYAAGYNIAQEKKDERPAKPEL